MTNLGVKALLSWVRSLELSTKEITIENLQDGTVLENLILKLKRESNISLSNSFEERYRVIADFIEKDCRFDPTRGSFVSWDNIRDGSNLTVEIAKVLLLLVYHDMMNDRCTLNKMECETERELANLTTSFVMEIDGSVFLRNRLDVYFARHYLPCPRDIFGESTNSTSHGSSISSFSDDSPVINHKTKVRFVDLETVTSSSVSKSPLAELMNTPKFQMRKMQHNLVKEREYRDNLEKELSNSLAQITQKESHISQLQFNLDKLKEEQAKQEQAIREKITEFETKNSMLQIRFNEILNENKELKTTSTHMERRVDELCDENGALSSQVRTVSSQLSVFKTEVGRLTEAQTSAEEEWRHKTTDLQFELSQTTLQKEQLTEQIQILQEKISSLEDELSRTAEEVVGENMGPIIEREEITHLKLALENALCSLKEAEIEIQTKTQNLAEVQKEIYEQQALLEQQKAQSEEAIRAKDEILDKLKNDLIEQRSVLQQNIGDLELQLEQVERQKSKQVSELQRTIAACEQEVETLKRNKMETEDLLCQTEEKVKDLETEVCTLTLLLTNKKQEVTSLQEEVDKLTNETKQAKIEIEAKEEAAAKLVQEKSNEQEIFSTKIQTMTAQVKFLASSLQQAEDEIQLKQNRLAKSLQENIQLKNSLEEQISSREDEKRRLSAEILQRNEQLAALHAASAIQSKSLQEEIDVLKAQLQTLNDSYRKAEEKAAVQQDLLNKHEQESAHRAKVLQQRLSSSEEAVRNMKAEIHAKETQIELLKTHSLEQSESLHQQIEDLKEQIACLTSSLRASEENLRSKDNLLAEQRLQKEEVDSLKRQVELLASSLETAEEDLQSKENLLEEQNLKSALQIETLELQMAASQDEVKRLNAEITAKEEKFLQLQTESSTHAKSLQHEIEALNVQIKSITDALDAALDQVKGEQDLMHKQEEENALQVEELRKHGEALEEQVKHLKREIKTKEAELDELKTENHKESEILHSEMQTLRDQVETFKESYNTLKELCQAKENLLAQKDEVCREKADFKDTMAAAEKEITPLKVEIQMKEKNLATLTEEGAVNSETLQREIDRLGKELVDVNNLLTESQVQIQTQAVLINELERNTRHEKQLLQQQLSASNEEVEQMKEAIQAKEKEMLLLENNTEESVKFLNQEIQRLNKQVESLDSSLKKAEEDVQSKDDLLSQQQQEILHHQQVFESLQEKVQLLELVKEQVSSKEEEIQKLKESLTEKEHSLTVARDNLQNLQIQLVDAKEVISNQDQVLEGMKDQIATETQLAQKAKAEVEATKRNLDQIKMESSNQTSVLQNVIQKLQSEIETSSEMLMAKEQKILETDRLVQAADHYKVQMEKAVRHYNSKKQLLHESQEETKQLKHSLDVRDQELKTLSMEKKLLELDLDKAQANEKKLLDKVAYLEAQLTYADQTLRAQNKIHGQGGSATTDACYLEVPPIFTRAQVKKSMSSDSLDQSSLDDSLNSTRKPSTPGESSTPLVRSSERLAAKHRGVKAESLETLYFTPINTKQIKRASPENDGGLDSDWKYPTSSVKRRRTTQKTPGGKEDESFFSLASARSQPNLSGVHATQPTTMQLFETPARKTDADSDQLIGLPGYRRSTTHSHAASTFCVGAENEPDGGPEDWLRIAELQARNKACLPHLKSSYPVEFEYGRGGTFNFTDEELRNGDPSDTIRRASMMPGQLQDSLVSHRHSIMLGQGRPHGLSSTTDKLASKPASSTITKSPRSSRQSSSTLALHQTFSENKTKASCFPRPLTPKNRNVCSGSNPQIQPILSPADRRQSMMFTIDNTPKSNNYLRKGLNRLRNSTRKSPGKSLRKSPAHTSQENPSAIKSRAGVGRAIKTSNFKSPQTAVRGSGKSQISTRSAKSPGLTASARKIMRRIKV